MHAESSASRRTAKSFARRRPGAAYLYAGRTLGRHRTSRRIEHATQQATWINGCRMTLDDDDIERIAQRVAELIGSAQATVGRRYVDAADLAQMLGLERAWIYAHARELGAIRLGGPGGRLRFDLQRVAEALSASAPVGPPVGRVSARRRRSAAAAQTEVIQYER